MASNASRNLCKLQNNGYGMRPWVYKPRDCPSPKHGTHNFPHALHLLSMAVAPITNTGSCWARLQDNGPAPAPSAATLAEHLDLGSKLDQQPTECVGSYYFPHQDSRVWTLLLNWTQGMFVHCWFFSSSFVAWQMPRGRDDIFNLSLVNGTSDGLHG